jgi:hypothetical protein
MQAPSFIKNMTGAEGSNHSTSFFSSYPVLEMIRGLFISSILWFLLAVGVYAVYTMVLGTS